MRSADIQRSWMHPRPTSAYAEFESEAPLPLFSACRLAQRLDSRELALCVLGAFGPNPASGSNTDSRMARRLYGLLTSSEAGRAAAVEAI